MPGAVFDPIQLLADRFRAAILNAFPNLAGEAIDPLVAPSKQPALGDFQCNAAMGLGKRLGKNPREIAGAIVRHVDVRDIAEPIDERSIAGPGFINVRLRGEALGELLASMDTPALGVPTPRADEPARTVVVDLCGVNLAKQMHVGHLRATVIGDAVARTLERLGHRVIRQNHVGDWGLPIAMVTGRLAEAAARGQDLARLSLDDLEREYRAAQRDCDADEAGLRAVRRHGLGPKAAAELEEQVAGAEGALARARVTLVRLQAHDAPTVAVWKRIADITMSACLATVARLRARVGPEDSAGESSYAEELPGVVEDLARRAIAEESDGALVVRLDRPEWGGIEEPCIVRKRDGGFLYATTDLAAIRRRVGRFGASRVVYCVDARQSLHFRQVFAAARRAGYDLVPPPPAGARASLEHAAFGTVLGDDGRPFRTRTGENVKLSDLIDEAVARAGAAVAAKNPALCAEERAPIAEAVAVAAIKYADLCNDRTRDYAFSFDRMLAFEGNTGPYLLYALVRIRSIFRKAQERGVGPGPGAPARFRIAEPAEKTLALALLRYPGALRAAGEASEPHRICQYLYDLAGAFSTFFDACPVLGAPDAPTRAARLRLCDLTARVLEDGVTALGIPTLDRM